MKTRSMEYGEALALFDKLRDAGYPVQIWYQDSKWHVKVSQMLTNSKANLDSF